MLKTFFRVDRIVGSIVFDSMGKFKNILTKGEYGGGRAALRAAARLFQRLQTIGDGIELIGVSRQQYLRALGKEGTYRVIFQHDEPVHQSVAGLLQVALGLIEEVALSEDGPQTTDKKIEVGELLIQLLQTGGLKASLLNQGVVFVGALDDVKA